MQEQKSFRFIANFYGHNNLFNRDWTFHKGIRESPYGGFPYHTKYFKDLAEQWSVPLEKLWFTKTDDDRLILETWSVKKEFHDMFEMDYFFWEVSDTSDFLWGLDLFGTDDDMLLAKLSLPSWLFYKKLN